MPTTIQIFPDDNVSGSEELVNDIKKELAALEIGEVDEITGKAEDGKLTIGLDVATLTLIVNSARLSFDVLKAIIGVIKEARLRYADKKKIDPNKAPGITVTLKDDTAKKSSKLKIPSGKGTETKFIKGTEKRKGNKK